MLQSMRLRAARSVPARNRAVFTCARNANGSGPLAGADPCAPARDASAAAANATTASSNIRIFDMVPPVPNSSRSLSSERAGSIVGGGRRYQFAREGDQSSLTPPVSWEDEATETQRARRWLGTNAISRMVERRASLRDSGRRSANTGRLIVAQSLLKPGGDDSPAG